ncbi:dual specificity protein phosphatase 13B-like [Ambystoma mexicanum]|uniref:dual specificity protein phosphatase 13B-like n=1 Tax=Ambystoma mexicanum TaxID=8296 RepID=UPI0037E80D1C
MSCTGEDDCKLWGRCQGCCQEAWPNQVLRQVPHQTPTVWQLQQMLGARTCCPNQEDEVWPNLFLGDEYSAMDIDKLQCMGITHILNAAHDTQEVSTEAMYYKCFPITYYGVKALDERTFDISRFFCEACRFIDIGLRTPGGKVLVHSVQGNSRAATLVLAYLMIYQNTCLVDAIRTVISRRYIFPNEAFLQQLRCLDMQL